MSDPIVFEGFSNVPLKFHNPFLHHLHCYSLHSYLPSLHRTTHKSQSTQVSFLAKISKVLPPILPKTTWSHQPQQYPMNLVPIPYPSSFYCGDKTLTKSDFWRKKLVSAHSFIVHWGPGGRNCSRDYRGLRLCGFYSMTHSACFLT